MIVDAGGGTIDITCHEMLGKNKPLKELVPPSGGPWGSSYVNENFIHFLKELCKNGVSWEKVMQSEEWEVLLDKFEVVIVSI